METFVDEDFSGVFKFDLELGFCTGCCIGGNILFNEVFDIDTGWCIGGVLLLFNEVFCNYVE